MTDARTGGTSGTTGTTGGNHTYLTYHQGGAAEGLPSDNHSGSTGYSGSTGNISGSGPETYSSSSQLGTGSHASDYNTGSNTSDYNTGNKTGNTSGGNFGDSQATTEGSVGTQQKAGGLLHGTPNTGAERLNSSNDPLGLDNNNTAGTNASSGDARSDAQRTSDTAGTGTTGTREPAEGKASEGNEKTVADDEGHQVADEATIKARQSDKVNEILAEADSESLPSTDEEALIRVEIVKEKGLSKEPEKDNQMQEQSHEAGVGSENTDKHGEHKEKVSMMDKIKAKVHKS